jgi:hypothetical protein
LLLYVCDHLRDRFDAEVTHAAPMAEWTLLWTVTIARSAIETTHPGGP